MMRPLSDSGMRQAVPLERFARQLDPVAAFRPQPPGRVHHAQLAALRR